MKLAREADAIADDLTRPDDPNAENYRRSRTTGADGPSPIRKRCIETSDQWPAPVPARVERSRLVPLHNDFNSLKSILAKIRISPSGYVSGLLADLFRLRSTSQNHCDGVLDGQLLP
jgi:hypothetical protein